jgi:adenylate cyclase
MTQRLRSTLVASAIVAAVTLLFAGASLLGFGNSLVHHTWDLLWPDGSAGRNVVVVAVDQKSIDHYGAWPWSDARQARLIEAVKAQNPRSIGYDVLLTQKSAAGFSGLASALENAGAVTPRAFADVSPTQLGLYRGNDEVRSALPPAVEKFAGDAVTVADDDGVIRTSPLVIEAPNGSLLPSLALRTAAASMGYASDPVRVGATSVSMGDLDVPTERYASIRVHWASGFGAGERQVVSAADVLDGRVRSGLLRNSIVLVGATAPALGDEHSSPLQDDATTPGVVVQAEIADTIVGSKWTAATPFLLTVIEVLLFGFAIAAAALQLKLRWMLGVGVAALVLHVGLSLVLFGTEGWLADFVRVPSALIAVAIGAIGIRSLSDQRRRRELGELFERYVPHFGLNDSRGADVVRELESGHELEGTVLFCDLRGFTPVAASLELGAVQKLLDEFYEYLYTSVNAHGGTVIKFIGDEVLALFPGVETGRLAWTVARELQDGAPALRTRLTAWELPPISFGIGIHTGSVFAAHLGPRQRRQFDIVGDAVNIASRLCGLAGANEIVGSGPQPDHGPPLGQQQSVTVKGRDTALDVTRVTYSRVEPADQPR